MNAIRKLAGHTVLYGLSSVVPKIINYLLVPFYTIVAFVPVQYGVVTEFYAYIPFLAILLTYGMETGFFRFSSYGNDSNNNFASGNNSVSRVFGTTFLSVLSTTIVFIALGILFSGRLADMLGYSGQSYYLKWSFLILGFDALTAIPFALLRQQGRPVKFAAYKIGGVLINIFFNVFFLWFCRNNADLPLISWFYRPDWGVEYVFISNLIASGAVFLVLIPLVLKQSLRFDFSLWKQIIMYSLPLMFAGFLGTINETLDRGLLKYMLPEASNPLEQLGIYGANMKIAVLMIMFIQMFRYAAEPFFFSQMGKKDEKQNMADIMKYFIITGLFLFLGVTLYIDVFKYGIGEKYWGGLSIVPIVLLANLFLGIYYNLSIWFKINNMTHYGIITAAIGALVTILVNVVFIPVYGYMASAWAHLLCYLVVVFVTYWFGTKYYPVPYNIREIGIYFLLALSIFFMSELVTFSSFILNFLKNTAFFAIFAVYTYKKETRKQL